MDIQNAINNLLVNSDEIKKAYPTVTNIRHEIMDIPYTDLTHFAQTETCTIQMDNTLKRAYVIHSPLVNGKMDTDIWLYSKRLQIIPSHIIEENEQTNTY